MALGLGYWQTQRLIILPQALKIAIPPSSTPSSACSRTPRWSPSSAFDLVLATRRRSVIPEWRAFFIEAYLFIMVIYLLDLLLLHVEVQPGTRAPPRHGSAQLEGRPRWHGPGRSRADIRPRPVASTRSDEIIEMIGVHKWFGDFHVLKDINLRVRKGERSSSAAPRAPASRPDPLHQPAGGAPEGADHRRRHRADQRRQEDRRDPPRGRHGVPALQPVPASDDARELLPRADLGEEGAQGRRPRRSPCAISSGSRSPSRRTNIRASSPAASSSAWRSPARCA
jgi:hypothetical protein